MKGAVDLAGVTLTVRYDSNVLTATEPTDNGLITGLFEFNNNNPGSTRIAIAGSGVFTGDGDLVTLNFNIKPGSNSGLSIIGFSQVELNDSEGKPMQWHTTSIGAISIE